ncbi:RDD family protein [Actinopolymorpha pittospori]|uniref:RDD family membrane protein YckC n=1 Tax=Actinopolymorpha pittospori TaxID=648752 RepID=A0A927MRE7_9ACTN|nr:RDD family protein [Actinopolymorpha pittospori]MBE1603508.1 putative RDD family membrane protein YckC [Actinopolymorpha pittospori]
MVALGWDYLLIVGWLALLAGLYLLGLRPLDRLAGAPLVVADLAITGLSVVPVWVYLVVTEAGTVQATWGKRRAKLIVTVGSGSGRAGQVRVMARNAVKLLPWELAHLAVLRFWTGEDDSVVAVVALVLCYGLIVATVALMLLRPDRAALHDLVAGTRVVTR